MTSQSGGMDCHHRNRSLLSESLTVLDSFQGIIQEFKNHIWPRNGYNPRKGSKIRQAASAIGFLLEIIQEDDWVDGELSFNGPAFRFIFKGWKRRFERPTQAISW